MWKKKPRMGGGMALSVIWDVGVISAKGDHQSQDESYRNKFRARILTMSLIHEICFLHPQSRKKNVSSVSSKAQSDEIIS